MLLSKFSVEDPGPSVEMTVKQSGQKARFIIKESHTPEEYRAITGEEPKDENVLSDSQIIDIGKKGFGCPYRLSAESFLRVSIVV